MALVDANYKFIYVNVGASLRARDAGVYNESTLKKVVLNNMVNLPPPATIEGIASKINVHIVGDDAFAMDKNLMKPYPHKSLDKEKRIFNYRLSRARRVVENAFGILTNRWRVFLTRIKLCPDKVTYLVPAACCLHNFLVEKNKHSYTSAADADAENRDHTVTPGLWSSDPSLTRTDPSNTNRNPPKNTKDQRQSLTLYFNTNGAVPWQDIMVS